MAGVWAVHHTGLANSCMLRNSQTCLPRNSVSICRPRWPSWLTGGWHPRMSLESSPAFLRDFLLADQLMVALVCCLGMSIWLLDMRGGGRSLLLRLMIQTFHGSTLAELACAPSVVGGALWLFLTAQLTPNHQLSGLGCRRHLCAA